MPTSRIYKAAASILLLTSLAGCSDVEKIVSCIERPIQPARNGQSEIETLFLDQIQRQFSLEYAGLDENYKTKENGVEQIGAIKLLLKYTGGLKAKGVVVSYKIFADGKEIGTGGGRWDKTSLEGKILSSETAILVDQTVHSKTDMYHLLKTANKISLKVSRLHPEYILINVEGQTEPKEISLSKYFQR